MVEWEDVRKCELLNNSTGEFVVCHICHKGKVIRFYWEDDGIQYETTYFDADSFVKTWKIVWIRR